MVELDDLQKAMEYARFDPRELPEVLEAVAALYPAGSPGWKAAKALGRTLETAPILFGDDLEDYADDRADDAKEEGREAGYEEGYEVGHDAGYVEGYDDALSKGE